MCYRVKVELYDESNISEPVPEEEEEGGDWQGERGGDWQGEVEEKEEEVTPARASQRGRKRGRGKKVSRG